MNRIFIRVFLSFIVPVHLFATSANQTDLKEEAKQESVQSISSLFPEHFTVEQLEELKTKKATRTPFGLIRLDDINHALLIATTPYFFQIYTGTDSKFAAHIKKVDGTEAALDRTHLKATYRFHSSYMVRNNADFDVTLESDCFKNFCLTDSVLGDKDFISTPEQLTKDSSFFCIANTDEQFIRQTLSLHRLNRNMTKWLLILAHLQGEDLFSCDQEARENRGNELYATYLQKNGYQLNVNNVLQMNEYVRINEDLRGDILGHFGLTLQDVPSMEKIAAENRVNDLENGRLYIAKIIRNHS